MTSIFLRRPPQQKVAPLPDIGAPVPERPGSDNSLILFLRHVGCPFAEQAVREARIWKEHHPDVTVFVVSHGSAEATMAWLKVIGGAGGLEVLTDPQRDLYGAWGLGYSGGWHFMGIASLVGVVSLWPKGIYNRQASGTRWQRAGYFRVRSGRLVWRCIPDSAQQFSLPEN